MNKKFVAVMLTAGFLPTLCSCGNTDTLTNTDIKALDETISEFSLAEVTALDAYEKNASALEIQYLKSLDADRLLRGFCDIAGKESNAPKYGGWEDSAIQGHTLGHYLCAVSQGFASSGDEELKEISEHIVEVLYACQNSETGYLAAIDESHYERIENGNTSGTWVPWYSMHKIFTGLISAYEHTGNELALTIASRLGDWVYSRTSVWSEEMQAVVLNVEYGGMNDCLYQLYKHTRDEKHLSAAHSFDEMTLFEPLYKGEDVLNGKHANTTIPKIIGALNRYTVTGEEYYLQVAANFWEMVVNNHTYITGGNSEWEHFGEGGVLDAERTNCNCETCNTYNMLKLSRLLFTITGESKYADFYENAFINAILSSQNPGTGMTTYFQPMATGFFKVYSSPDEHFWCCTGTGMENFTKLSEGIYYHSRNTLFVTRFTSSELDWEEKGIKIIQDTALPDVTLTMQGTGSFELALRVPYWCADKPVLSVNGENIEADVNDGFIYIFREWHDGDIIKYTLPLCVTAYSLPDNENAVAFRYGPYVLSADLGNEDMQTSTTGVNVTVPLADTSVSELIKTDGTSVEKWLKNVNENLVKDENSLSFTLRGTNRELVFSPHFMQHENRYGIYFILTDKDEDIKENTADKYTVVDSLPVGNDQYEFSHNLNAENSNTGNFKGLMFRDAAPDGFFSFDMKIDSSAVNYLLVKYYSGDVGRSFRIIVDGELLADVVLGDENPNGFYDVYYKIPEELTQGKESVNIRFEANNQSFAGGIFDKLSIVKEKISQVQK